MYMGEHDTESAGGIPANGVPSDKAVRQEREQWDEGKTVKERIYETTLTLREPTPVSVVADRAECTPASARRHLRWFAEIGIVEPVGEGQPAQFQRSKAVA
ncbi:winged helix-turn-helix domain-containing protein [Halococcus morrhuae DSM 1307]|nr:helix-turn-helix domain-containing protein [Halococcus morrhuae]